jgi:hypothetical protein
MRRFLFGADHSYVLAFSLMMLHTDAFNKNNRNKMTKADYVKNTRLPGVLPEMLEVRGQIFRPRSKIDFDLSISLTISLLHRLSLLKTQWTSTVKEDLISL